MALQRVPNDFVHAVVQSFSASSALRSGLRCLREPRDAVHGAKLLSLESAVDYRSLFATPSRFGLRD